MAGTSTFLKSKLIDHIFRSSAYTMPTNLYVSLHTADPTGTGMIGEVTGAGYQREPLLPGPANWNNSNGEAINNATVIFTEAEANWGIVTHFAIWDSATAGNMLISGQLTVPREVKHNDIVSFPTSFLIVHFS